MFNEICGYGNLLNAWRKTERLKKYRNDVMFFRSKLDDHLCLIQEELINQTYSVSEYKNYVVYEPKKRQISALPLKDRVVQHALVNFIEPIIDKSFIFDSHACRAGHGLKLAVDRFVKFSRQNKFCLKCDIRSYFASIDHDILKKAYRRKVKCEKTLWLIDLIIDSTPGTGLPIGSLLSQLSANLYLHELDIFIKHSLGGKHYIRYMDDFVIFGESRETLMRTKSNIRAFLNHSLRLDIAENKSRIHETANGVEFCGFVCYPGRAIVKKATVRRNGARMLLLARQLEMGEITPETFASSLSSVLGHSMYSRNYSYRTNLCDKLEDKLCITK